MEIIPFLFLLGWFQPGQRLFTEKNPVDDPVDFLKAGSVMLDGLLGCFIGLVAVIVLLLATILGLVIWVCVK